MTELSFLIELLLNHKLPPATKKAIAERIKLVEQMPAQPMMVRLSAPATVPQHLVGQSPSTIAAMMRHEAGGAPTAIAIAPAPEPKPVAIVAQTPAAQAAIADRQAAISAAVSGKPEKGRTSPRKF